MSAGVAGGSPCASSRFVYNHAPVGHMSLGVVAAAAAAAAASLLLLVAVCCAWSSRQVM